MRPETEDRMSTKCSTFYWSDDTPDGLYKKIHVYYEMNDGRYYLEASNPENEGNEIGGEVRICIPEALATSFTHGSSRK